MQLPDAEEFRARAYFWCKTWRVWLSSLLFPKLTPTCSKSCEVVQAKPHRCRALGGWRGGPYPGRDIPGSPLARPCHSNYQIRQRSSLKSTNPAARGAQPHHNPQHGRQAATASSMPEGNDRTTGVDGAWQWCRRVLYCCLTASEPNRQLRDHRLMNCMERSVCESPYPGWVRTPTVPYLGVITLHEHVNH